MHIRDPFNGDQLLIFGHDVNLDIIAEMLDIRRMELERRPAHNRGDEEGE